MNISILASIWSENLWDELILKNEIALLKKEFWKKTQFQVASYDFKKPVFQIQNTQYFEYFPIWIKNPKNFYRNIKNFLKFLRVIIWSDVVVVGWGGIIYDSEIQSVKNPLNQWVFRTRMARIFWKKLYFYAVWVDIKQQENNKKLKKIFRTAYKVTVRDKKSQEQLKNIGIKSKVVDDPVMQDAEEKWKILWTHSSKKFKLHDFKSYNFAGKKVGLALRSWYIGTSGDARVEKLLVEELCGYIEKQGWKIVFLPHSLHQTDIRANDYEFMKQFLNYDREIYATLGEVYTAYTHKMLDIVISMRLHSIILSHVYRIDQIVLSYSQKTEQVIKKLRR